MKDWDIAALVLAIICTVACFIGGYVVYYACTYGDLFFICLYGFMEIALLIGTIFVWRCMFKKSN